MSKLWIQGIALIVLLVPFALISLGTTREVPALWWAGLALLALGGLVPPITRYALDGARDDDTDEEGG